MEAAATGQTWQIGAIADPSLGPVIDLGPDHPMRTGLVRIDIREVDGAISAADVSCGWSHRGAEKLFEVRDPRQVLMLADRHDWHAAFAGELVAALAAEALLGLRPPQRATVLRTVLAEQARVGSHLAFLSFLPHWFDDDALAHTLRSVRNAGRELMMELSGNRVHPMLNRLGGLAYDATQEWLERLDGWLAAVEQVTERLRAHADAIGTAHPGLATISDAIIDSYGLSGPVARACGRAADLRRTDTLLAYPSLHLEPTPRAEGSDAGARFIQWCAEIGDSIRIARAGIAAVEPGPVNVQLARIIRFPEGEAWVSFEAPQGRASVWLVSRGQRTPWRLKLRTPSFTTVSAWAAVLPGTPIDLLPVAVASMPYTIGDLDK